MASSQTRKRLFFLFLLWDITLELNTKKHSPTRDNQLERNEIRVIKINLKQREYNFFVAFSFNMLLIWKETVTDREIGYVKYGEYGIYVSDWV